MRISIDNCLSVLRAAGEETRIRILLLLADGELTVSDLTRILVQSQPRISRHLKLLVEAGLVERVREGSWAFYRVAEKQVQSGLLTDILAHIDLDDATAKRDRGRLQDVRSERAQRAADYFASHADHWDEIRSLHADEALVEAAILDSLGDRQFRSLIDLGTGTGRMLNLLASRVQDGLGVDLSREMLGVARAALDESGVRNCRVRHGDIASVPLDAESADLIVIHQVLHFLEDPAAALREAARLMAPGGELVIVDFAPHENEFLRDQHSHLRLGFATDQIVRWLHAAGLSFERHIDLKPDVTEGANGMTVSIWLARDPRPAAPVVSSSEQDVA